MTALDLDAVRARADAATPGPWSGGGPYIRNWEVVIAPNLPLVELTVDPQGEANAAFIASARTDVPALLGEIDRLNAAITVIRGGLVERLDRAKAYHYRAAMQKAIALVDSALANGGDPR